MKKALLLILTSLVCLAGCHKEDKEPATDGPVTHEYTCKCGAVYSVTCKNPNYRGSASFAGGNEWTLFTNPSWGEWTVTDESGQNVPYYEHWTGQMSYFICTCGEKSKEFNREEFKTQIFRP